MRIAVITGASSGLGREYVRQLAGKFPGIDEIWAVARRKDRLKALDALTDVPVRPVPLDLTLPSSIDTLEKMFRDEQPDIAVLINAAGFGKIGGYSAVSREDLDGMIDLNCRAAVDVTCVSLPYMKRGARILEICSTSAFQPFPYLNVYAASKAFLYRYSRALRFELLGKEISVTAVCPYWIRDTEFIPNAERSDSVPGSVEENGSSSGTEKSRKIRHYPFSSKASSVVRRSLIDSALDFAVSTPGPVCTLHRIAAKLIPAEFMMWIWEGIRKL